MKYNVSDTLEERWGVISNLHCFLHRHLDTGFKTKWSGFWSPPYKFMDYYSFKINGIALGPETVRAVEYGEEMIFHHETDSLRIREKVCAPSTVPGIEVSLELENKMDKKKAVHAVLKPGVDIRHQSHDIEEKEYDMEEGPNRVTLSRDGKKLMITSDEEFKLRGEPHSREHFPGEKQKCFIPGDITFRKELEDEEALKVQFTTSDGVFGELEKVDQSLEGEGLERLFNYSIESMKNLVYEKEGTTGLIAGHPWFQSFWARDSMWTVLGLIDAGYFELSEDILTEFARNGLPDRIKMEKGIEKTGKSDTIPLFVIASDKLERHFRINDAIEEARKEVGEELDLDEGVVQHEADGTWMDTLERDEAVDIQALWLEAAEILGLEVSEELESGLEKFCDQEYMADHLGEDSPTTINPAVSLMFGQIEEEGRAENYLQKINGELSSHQGARTRAVTDPGYDPSGYHEGSTWGLTTGWAAAANLEYGNGSHGKSFLEKMKGFLDRNQLGALPEVVNSENGELLGCGEQAWSAGIMVHIIDSYLLGIEVRSPDKIIIDPAEELNCLRTGKKVGDQIIDIRISDGEAEVLNDPDLEVELR
ncbi:MAG: amylo-alpha-1,6-glucosidase [Candidatus Nanosalina sp.]